MSTELINRITIEKDGVYLSSHSNNDTAPFHSWRCKRLSEVYSAEGQKGLDREIVRMLYEHAELRGKHPSVLRYKNTLNKIAVHEVYRHYIGLIDSKYEALSSTDKKSVWYKPTPQAKEYLQYEQDMRDKMYSEIASFCAVYQKEKISER